MKIKNGLTQHGVSLAIDFAEVVPRVDSVFVVAFDYGAPERLAVRQHCRC